MDDSFELLKPQEAREFLREFPAQMRRRGEACYRRGGVLELTVQEPGRDYLARVQDGEVCQVRLYYLSEDGWDGECSCPELFDCHHVFAAMSALLAEHSTAAVRKLSSTQPSAAELLAAPRSKAGPKAAQSLAAALMAANGRPLTDEEDEFVETVRAVYLRCRQYGKINYWEFQQMGMPLTVATWGPLDIWPSFPKTEQEFWLYVANAVQQQGYEIPQFMEPVSDLGPIQEPLARWRRVREIERWKQTLANLPPTSVPQTPVAPALVDLRLTIDADGVRLQWQRPGQTAFEPLKQSALRQLATDYQAGRLELPPEAELLWPFFSERLEFGMKVEWEFLSGASEALRGLNRVLRVRLAQSRIVDALGQPLARPVEPLRWTLTPANSEDEDYRIRLVQADGSAPPPLLCSLPGQPALYLTARAVFAGPDAWMAVLDPAHENCIPAPVIERAQGVAFLQSLGFELPPRLRERVRVAPYQIAISCDLRSSFPGSEYEDCVVNAAAEAPDGHRQVWTGHNWLDSTPKGAGKQARNDRVLTLYDSAMLATVPPLLEPLRLKPAFYGSGLTVRVSKKFPEVFAAWLKTVPPHIQVRLGGELASFATADVAGRVKLDVTEAEIDWFDLRVVLDVADTTLTAEEIKLLLNAKGRYVRLAGKGWRRLQYNLTEDEDERLARLGLSPRELSAEPQRLHALQLADEAARKFLPEQQVEQVQRRASELKARVAPPLPGGVTAQLRPYQIEGFHFLAYLSANRFGGILADDMGLGKTLQALAWLLWLREQAQPRPREPAAVNHQAPSLVVCPKSVMDNWHAEAKQFTPGLRVRIWSASELDGFAHGLDTADLHVVNYSQLRTLGETLAPVRWLALILDEGQYIKNPNSQTAQVARSLRAQQRLILSGTPIENRLLDLWSLMAFAMPGVLSSRAQFAKLYDAKGDPFARRRLAARVRPFVLRRTKGQVAKDLPDRIEEDLLCEIEGEQQALYRAELKRAQQLLLRIQTQQELAKQQFHFLTSLLRLRQICCDPRLVKPDSTAPGAKAEALLEQLEPLMEEGQKVLVFSQFVEMLNLLRPALAERDWPIFYLAGDTENRGELVRDFQKAKGPAVFLISLKAGGFGLNLTAASYVVLFDPWWNPAVEAQAIDRTHRIGQTNKVIAYRLLIKNSIEEKIRELQKTKKALAEDVLGEEKFAQSLTLDDLRFLFAD